MNDEYGKLTQCADRISKSWRESGRSVDEFPSIVLAETESLDLSYFGDIANLHKLSSIPEVAALQRYSTFSDLYFKLYDDGFFWVEVLNWWGSDINIHDHDFSGVQFQLAGRSLNVKYKFVEDGDFSGLATGQIAVESAQVWNERTRSLVLPGDLEPHTVNHLDVPTVSLLIRTHPAPSLPRQNNYFPPGVRHSYGIADIQFRLRLKMLRLMARSQPEDFVERFSSTVRMQTPGQNLFTLIKMVDILFRPQYVHALLEYCDSGLEKAPEIVQAARYFQASDYLTNDLRKTPGVSRGDMLSLSVLAASFDADSLLAIESAVNQLGHETNIKGAVRRVLSNKSERHRNEIERISKLYELELV